MLKNVQITIQMRAVFQTSQLPKPFLFHLSIGWNLEKQCFTNPGSKIEEVPRVKFH